MSESLCVLSCACHNVFLCVPHSISAACACLLVSDYFFVRATTKRSRVGDVLIHLFPFRPVQCAPVSNRPLPLRPDGDRGCHFALNQQFYTMQSQTAPWTFNYNQALKSVRLNLSLMTSEAIFTFFFHVPYLDAWVLPWFALIEWVRVQRCCTELFHAFSLDSLNGSTAHRTGRLVHSTVRGNCLLKVMGQETCQSPNNPAFTPTLLGKYGALNPNGGSTINTTAIIDYNSLTEEHLRPRETSAPHIS